MKNISLFKKITVKSKNVDFKQNKCSTYFCSCNWFIKPINYNLPKACLTNLPDSPSCPENVSVSSVTIKRTLLLSMCERVWIHGYVF